MFEKLVSHILGRVPVQSKYAKVTKINDNQTIDCSDLVDKTEYKEVQLTATESDNLYLKLVPKVGSVVLISSINNSQEDYYVSMFSEIETLDLITNKLVFNEGKLGGMVKIKELESNLERLKTYCETLKSAIGSGLGAVGAGVAANGASGASAFNGAMESAVISFEDMENDKILM